jgi:twitching motility two-component system response regulator PilH
MAIKKVLVVDDSPTEALHLSEILGKNGFKVTVAADSEQAMTKLEAETFDLIMCTTKGLETDRVWGMRQGASDYIVKPVKAEELLEKIAKLAQ